jgi:hypothetical protein
MTEADNSKQQMNPYNAHEIEYIFKDILKSFHFKTIYARNVNEMKPPCKYYPHNAKTELHSSAITGQNIMINKSYLFI